MQLRKALAAGALLGLVLNPANALASAPAGVWVKVQKVVFAPNATSPTQVQVHGALMLFDGSSEPSRPYPRYTPPAFGYVYYECPAGEAETCRQEWSDLEANIAKADNICVGFGWDSLPTGTLRQPGSAPANPDAYPIQNGVSSGFSPCQVIGQFLSSHQGGAGGAGGAAGSAGMGSANTNQGAAGASAGAGGMDRGGSSVVPEADGGPDEPTSAGGSGGPTGSGKAGASTTGRAGSGSTSGKPDQPDKDEPVESKGCSVAGATGAASFLGLGAALGLVGLALSRRQRSRK